MRPHLIGWNSDAGGAGGEARAEAATAVALGVTALGEINAIDKAEFSNVISGIDGLITRLGQAATEAAKLKAALPFGGAVGSGRGGDPITSQRLFSAS